MGLHSIKLVTFDATNTLLKFRISPWQYYTVVARDHGFKGSEKDLKGPFLSNFKTMWSKYPNFGKNSINWEEWWTQVVKLTFNGKLPMSADIDSIAVRLINDFKTSKCWCVADGSEKLLDLLHSHGITVGVISNSDPRLNEILHNVKLHDHFEFILTSYDSGYSKPDERIFKQAIKKCKKYIEPHQSLHIGDDMQKDFEAARAAGWHAVLVTDRQNETETPPARENVFKTLRELYLAIEENKLKF